MNAHRFNLESLRHTVAVETEGSFSAAARAHGISQPTLSNSVAKLERQLGWEMFSRSPQGVSTTDFGKNILPLIKDALGALENISRTADLIANPCNQNIRIGTTALTNPDLLSGFQRSLRDSAYSPKIALTEANLPKLRKLLSTGELDLILIPAVAPMKGFEHRIIDSEPIMAVGTNCSHQSPIQIGELGNTTLIFSEPQSGLATFTRELLDSHNLKVHQYPGESLTCTTMEKWAMLGFGIALLPTSQVSSDCSHFRPLLDGDHEVEIFYEAVWAPTSPLAHEISTTIAKTIQDLNVLRV